MTFSFTDKVMLVTGGAGGIGSAMCRRFALGGARCIVVGAMLSIALDLKGKGILAGSVLPSATDTQMLRQEAVDGGNSLQFQEQPQQPEDVVAAVVSLLNRPRLEAYARSGESLLVRIAMLAPNLLPRVFPLFRKRGERGLARYLEDLRGRGLARCVNGRWELVEEA